MESKKIAVFIFDSGKLGDSSYGDVVFEHMLSGGEISDNSSKVIVSLGDILFNKSHIDIEPYIINNDFCTVNLETLDKVNPFADYPFCWVLEDIDAEIAIKIDQRLKSELTGYIGLSEIDISLTDSRKQFWKQLCCDFAIDGKAIICFQDPEINDIFCYSELAEKYGYEVRYDPIAEYFDVESCSNLQSSFVKCNEDLKIKDFRMKEDKENGMDRDLLSLNFSLCGELEVAGDFIWKSINEISKIHFQTSAEKYLFDSSNAWPEYAFLTLYFASQGIERLQKIIVELVVKSNHLQSEEKEKAFSLLTGHQHTALNDWIERQTGTNLNSACKNIISMVQDFYNHLRYGRYIDIPVEDKRKEYDLLYSLKNDNENPDDSIKKSFGKNMKSISKEYYSVIRKYCTKLNIYAYELQYNSASAFVFSRKENNLYKLFLQIRQFKKELLYWLLKNGEQYPKFKVASVDGLDFDPEMIDTYLEELIDNPEIPLRLYDEADALYDALYEKNNEKWAERKDLVDAVIANSSVVIYEDLYEEDCDS